MSLVVCSPDQSGGGIETYYTQLFESWSRLIDTRAAPKVIASSPFNGRRAPEIRLPLLPRQLANMIGFARQSYFDALAHTPAILEVCDWPLNFVPAVTEGRVPYIIQCHGSMGQIAEHDPQQGSQLADGLVQLIEPQLLRVAHRVQTYSNANQHFWERATGRRVEMIRPAFALPLLPADVSIAPVGRGFGRLQRWKGPHVLCRALQRLGRRAPQIEWYGGVKPWTSGEWPADRRLATDYPDVWGTTFHHLPAIPRDRVLRLQASALFNVVPSTWDVFNFTAVESMAAARPTIISTGAGASELIVNGENGFTFSNGNSEALADVIDRVLTMSEARRREIGAAARQTIGIELDPKRIIEKRLAAYGEAIRSFHDVPPSKPHEWLMDLLDPEKSFSGSFDALLDPVPLRAIAGHMVHRIVTKAKRRNT